LFTNVIILKNIQPVNTQNTIFFLRYTLRKYLVVIANGNKITIESAIDNLIEIIIDSFRLQVNTTATGFIEFVIEYTIDSLIEKLIGNFI